MSGPTFSGARSISLCVMASSAMELQLGYSDFYRPHTQKRTQTKCVHNLRVPCGIARMFTHAQTSTYAPDKTTEIDANKMRCCVAFYTCLSSRSDCSTYIPDESCLHVCWSREKHDYHQLEPHARIKMAQVLGSRVYICGMYISTNNVVETLACPDIHTVA